MNEIPGWANWAVKFRSGNVFVFEEKPSKSEDLGVWSARVGMYTAVDNSLVPYPLSWEDEYPISIQHMKIKNDLVNKPNHYIGVDGLEVETVLQNFLPKIKDPYVAHRVASAIEYLLRAPEKNGMQDYQKAGKNIEQIERYCKGKETTSDISTYYGGTNPND